MEAGGSRTMDCASLGAIEPLQRGRSVEPAALADAGKRINAVPPMHLGESRILTSLLKEAQQHQQQQHHKTNEDYLQENRDKELQRMLENYQKQVAAASSACTSMHQDIRASSFSREDIHNTTTMSHSQPCLINMGSGEHAVSEAEKRRLAFSRGHSTEQSCLVGPALAPPPPHPAAGGQHVGMPQGAPMGPPTGPPPQSLQNKPLGSSQKILASLRDENLHLRQQLDVMRIKTARLQQLESAHERIEKEYESLLRDKERQDGLERAAFVAMETQFKRLLSENEVLRDRLDSLSQAPPVAVAAAEQQVAKLNAIVAELAHQNQDLKGRTEQHAMELEAQAATLQEQRTHINMLEKALGNAQERLARKEKMCEEFSAAADESIVLRRMLQDTISDKQARDEAHSAERAQMEMELAQLKMHLNKDNSIVGIKKNNSSGRSETGEDTVARLKKSLVARDDRITQLEKMVMELQKRMHEEEERKKNAIGQLSESLEAKIRRLEEEKSEKDRRIAQLTEEKEKLAEMMRSDSDEDEARERRDLHRMEEIRQRIQERKRRQRPIGGLCGYGLVTATQHGRVPSSGSGGPLNMLPVAPLPSHPHHDHHNLPATSSSPAGAPSMSPRRSDPSVLLSHLRSDPPPQTTTMTPAEFASIYGISSAPFSHHQQHSSEGEAARPFLLPPVPTQSTTQEADV